MKFRCERYWAGSDIKEKVTQRPSRQDGSHLKFSAPNRIQFVYTWVTRNFGANLSPNSLREPCACTKFGRTRPETFDNPERLGVRTTPRRPCRSNFVTSPVPEPLLINYAKQTALHVGIPFWKSDDLRLTFVRCGLE